MRKIIIFLLLISAFSGICFADIDIAEFKNSNGISKELNLLFLKGMSRERLRSYDDALYAYNVVLSRVQGLVNSKNVSNATIRYAIPYAIAAAYRKGIVTHRKIEGSVVKLYNQLKLYEDEEKWINEVLTQISNAQIERGIEITEGEYGFLYFARAYNRMGWAYALFNGSYWKRYLIYTPSDTVLMVDRAIDDLQKMFSIYNPVFKEKPLVAIGNPAEAGMDFNENEMSAYELIAYSLCYNTNDVSRIKILMARQMENSVKASIDLYHSKSISRELDAGRKIFSYEDMMDIKSRDVVVAMGKILKEMGTN